MAATPIQARTRIPTAIPRPMEVLESSPWLYDAIRQWGRRSQLDFKFFHTTAIIKFFEVSCHVLPTEQYIIFP